MTSMTRPAGRARRIAATTIVLTLGLGLAACADNGSDAERAANANGVRSINKAGLEPTATTPETSTEPVARLGERKELTPGVVDVDGGFDTLTTPARAGFANERGGITVTEDSSGETRAFQRLCVGDIDIADSTRPITAEEYAQCRANGLDVVQFQVAADAIVLAIRSQTDVGTDCLSTDQVKAGFRAGSEITNWSQLGPNLDNVKFEAGGPTVERNAARFFGRYVLDNPEPVNSDFRVDYKATEDEDQTRFFVTGSDEDRERARELRYVKPVWVQYRAELKTAWGYWGEAKAEVVEAQRQQRLGIKDRRSPATRAAEDARVTRAFEALGVQITSVNAVKAKLKPVNTEYQALVRLARQVQDEYGHVGLFSHGYYATYEDRLRPFEIEISDGDDQPNCIFPSPQTILNGQYPLSRQLLLTVTRRSLQRPEVRAFLVNYLEHSQEYAEQEGVIALPNKDVLRQVNWIRDNKIPRFAVVDGQFREITETEELTQEPAPAAPAQNPAR